MIDLTKEEYKNLIQSGELWDKYPEAAGDYQTDCEVDLDKLYSLLCGADQEYKSEIYNRYFNDAIKLEGFTDKQVEVISYKALEDGHYAGYQEVVGCAMSLCEFAKKILDN